MILTLNEFGLSEKPAIEVFQDLRYEYKKGSELGPNASEPERQSLSDVVLRDRFKEKVMEFNKGEIPEEAIDEAIAQFLGFTSPKIIKNNKHFHEQLVNGVEIEYEKDGEQIGDRVQVVDFDNPENNDFLISNQFSIQIGDKPRRIPDILIFLNGIPIGIMELKDPSNPRASLEKAYKQITERYQRDIPDLFHFNEFQVVMDMDDAQMGCLSAGWEWFSVWNYIEEEGDVHPELPAAEVLIRGAFDKRRMLDLLENFIVFSEEEGKLKKKLAAYHQYYAVNEAIRSTVETVPRDDDKRIGLIWHTQGSGKSLSMVFYAKKARKRRELKNPTFVVLTDRTALDEQIHENFDNAGFTTQRAGSISDLRDKLDRRAGGTIFSLIHKFQTKRGEDLFSLKPATKYMEYLEEGNVNSELKEAFEKRSYDIEDDAELSVEDGKWFISENGEKEYRIEVRDEKLKVSEVVEEEFPTINERKNVIVIADEAHRSQFEDLAINVRKALPEASYIGFTATPIEMDDRSCKVVFGEYISKYPIDQSEEDNSTVPIFYESRMAKLRLRDDRIEDKFHQILGAESDDLKAEKAKEWSQLQKIIETHEERLSMISEDIVNHFNQRDIEGKALVVTISRKAAYKYYQKIKEIDEAPETALVISEPEEYISDYPKDKELKRRFKDPQDPLKIAVVCKKWITGFDAPHLHTLYLDRPMKNHNLLQAIGRVNRVYKDKPGGLIVDYIGIADNLKRALDKYTSDIQKQALSDIDVAIETMKEKYSEVASYFENVDYKSWTEKEGMDLQRLLHRAQNEVLETQEKKEEFLDKMTQLSKVYSLVSTHDEAIELRSEIVFFESVRDSIKKLDAPDREEESDEYDSALKELIAEGVSVGEMVEIGGFETREEISVLSEDFLDEVEDIEYENLQYKMLLRVLKNEISSRKNRNIAKYESFEEELKETVEKYNNNFLTTKEVIAELKSYADELQKMGDRKEKLGLEEDELAFYDAISNHTDKSIDPEDLKEIAIEIKNRLKEKASIDWTNRKKMRAKMKTEVKNILRNKGFSYKEYEPLIEPILKQAEASFGDMKVET